jgi:hypothetical protein
MRILLGIPCARVVRSQFFLDLLNWTYDSKHNIRHIVNNSSGRIDWSRSQLIDAAVKGGFDLHIQMDTDVCPMIPLQSVLSYINQDFSRGYDMVIGPTVGVNGRVMNNYGPDFHPPENFGSTCFDVHAGAFGFVAMSPRLMKKVTESPPASSIIDIGDNKHNIYMIYREGTTEDFDFCYRVRDLGFRVGVDPRIEMGHAKEVLLRPDWKRHTGTGPGTAPGEPNILLEDNETGKAREAGRWLDYKPGKFNVPGHIEQ